MSIKSTIAAVAASPFLFAGAAFAGPYVNVEANGSYPGGEYTSGNLEAQVGYEGVTEGGLAWYVSCLLYTSPSPRDGLLSRMPSSA